MKYENIWVNYLETRDECLKVAFSSNTQLRKAFLSKNEVFIILFKVDDIWLGSSEKRFDSLPQLEMENPSEEPKIYVKERKITIQKQIDGELSLDKGTFGGVEFSGYSGMKKLGEEVFEYLWERSETKVSELLRDFRLVGTSVVYKTTGDASALERIIGTMERAGLKLIRIPGDIPESDIMEIPFIFDRQLLITKDSKKYLETLREKYQRKGWDDRTLTKLLDLWK